MTSRSLRNLADALRAMCHRISDNVAADSLRDLNYSLQANRKTRKVSDRLQRRLIPAGAGNTWTFRSRRLT